MLIKIPFIQYLYGIKSMRQTMKEIEVNVAYRWFFGLDMLDPVPHFSTFGKNYTRRFKDTDLFEQIFSKILEKSTDGNESRAYLCMHEFEKTGKDPGKTRLEHSQIFVDFEENKNKSFKNSLDKLLPKKIIPVVIMLTRIPEDKKVNEITKEERKKLVDTLKDFRMTLTGLRGFNEAIITQGGVNVKEINPSTMESKIVSNVFFAGEVLDVDAVTGGFNLQVAWSTGYAAGNN